jgi:hypothetical protein
MAVIGSSVPFDTGAGPGGCVCADESCKHPDIMAKTTSVRRQRALRTIPVSSGLGECREGVTHNIAPNM